MKIKIRLIFAITILFSAGLSTSSPIENEANLNLAVRLDDLQSSIIQLKIQFEEEKVLRGNLQSSNAELEKKILQLADENAKQKYIFEAQIHLLMAQNAQQEKDILQLNKKRFEENTKNIVPKSHAKNEDVFNNVASDESSPRLPPSSCRQLSTIGHYLDGIYLVANADTSKIETVYCDFGSSTLSETLYGQVEIKTKSVNFFVQTNTRISLDNTVISFGVERLNEGGAMNLATGIFTVPVNGIYHFEFSDVKFSDSISLRVYLQVNGVSISQAYATNLPNYLGLSGINASLRLKSGDQVRLFKTTGTINGDPIISQFTGWLVEEDLLFV